MRIGDFKALPVGKYLFERRGQVAILFALMMPIFILMLGVVLDLGWYYLNVSRLQNAADAAAVAGANALIKDDEEDSISTFSDYTNVKLVGKYPGKDSNVYRPTTDSEKNRIEKTQIIANEYVAKNLSSNKDTIINSWTKTEVETDGGLYTKDNNLYYVVKLKEEIRHFFLPNWFDDMTAPVTAVALLSKTAIKDGSGVEDSENPTMTTMPIFDSGFVDSVVLEPEALAEIEKVLNDNMIVGNWQVQNKYKNQNKDKNKTYNLKDEYGDIIADPKTGKAYMITDFQRRFGYEVYSNCWNHFQDFYNHYNAGAFYRTQTITILDDVEFYHDPTGLNHDVNGDVIYETDGYGVRSSVAATSAAINPDTSSPAYNPGYKNKRKTYKKFIQSSNGIEKDIDEKDNTNDGVGLPYTWKRVDSLNADFRIEATLSGK